MKTLERQKKLGIVPQDAELTERPELFPAWEGLSETQKKLYTRQMEVFAGFSENADWNVGRLLDAIEDLGDRTTRWSSTSGATTAPAWKAQSPARSTTFLNGIVLEADQQLALIEQYGGIEALGNDHTAPHFASAPVHFRSEQGQPV